MFNSKIFSAIIAFLFVAHFSATAQSQTKTISLEQTVGEFTVKSLTLAPGDYQFEIANNGVDHEVGFVLVPQGKTGAANHIKEAYVQAPVKNGSKSLSKIVTLGAGEYEYFCPLNPTPKYSLTVTDKVENVKLTQVPGKFKTSTLTLTEGDYQFEIANAGVDHEVGFVVVPKGKYDAANHIKAAYVKTPVAEGKSSKTNIVSLKAGEYEYFCPLNPTPKYSIVVK